ncbi:MAG: hypothetical protein GY861_05890 [bacterium]|nr:hypothetical protein [bacterium]
MDYRFCDNNKCVICKARHGDWPRTPYPNFLCDQCWELFEDILDVYFRAYVTELPRWPLFLSRPRKVAYNRAKKEIKKHATKQHHHFIRKHLLREEK